MFGDILAGLHEALDDPEVRVVIIRSTGMAFSAGHDLSSPKDEKGQPEETPPIPPEFNPTMRDYYNVERRRCSKYMDLFNYPKITIAQCHGFVVGARDLPGARGQGRAGRAFSERPGSCEPGV